MTAARRIAVVPAFNEAATVAAVLDRLAPMVDQLVVVDDGSTDATRSIIEGWLPGHEHVRLLTFDRNRGMSAAYYLAFSDLRARMEAGELAGDDWVITVDADGQHDLAALAGLQRLAEADRLDALLARRDLSGYPWVKRAGNAALSRWATWWAGSPLLDVESGYRIFRLGALADALGYYRGYRYSETVEVAVVLCRLGYNLRNDVVVAVPLYRSRTRVRDAAIDLAAIPLAAWRVRRRRAGRPAGDTQELVEADGLEAPRRQPVEDDGQGVEQHRPVGHQVPVEPVVQVDDGAGPHPGQHPAGD
jgi:glycosyltransferase involved in cell wall biosynthesis